MPRLAPIAAEFTHRLCAVAASAAWLETGCDAFVAVVFVDDVDGVVFGVGAGDAEDSPNELKLGHLDLGRKWSRKDEGPPVELVVVRVLLEDAVDVHVEFVFDLDGQLDERFAHVRWVSLVHSACRSGRSARATLRRSRRVGVGNR